MGLDEGRSRRADWTGERLHGHTSCPQQYERHHRLQTEKESALRATTSKCSGDFFFFFFFGFLSHLRSYFVVSDVSHASPLTPYAFSPNFCEGRKEKRWKSETSYSRQVLCFHLVVPIVLMRPQMQHLNMN